MAKPKQGWIAWFIFEGIREGIAAFFQSYWPWSFPVLTAIGQFIWQIQWPIFFAALGTISCLAAIATVQILGWRDRRRFDNKLVVNLQSVNQYFLKDNPEQCGYRLSFNLTNTWSSPVYIIVRSIKWDIGRNGGEALDIVKTKAMLPPGNNEIRSHTIEGLLPDIYDGNFHVVIGLGNQFEKEKYVLETIGTYRLLASSDGPDAVFLPFSAKIATISLSEAE